jgi:hypothetical protein
MRLLVSLLVWVLRAVFRSRRCLALENLALRQQLAASTRTLKRPRLKPGERAFWVALSKIWRDWHSPLVLVKPATVIAWHRRAHQRYWTWKCGKPGRPPIPAEHIAFIRHYGQYHQRRAREGHERRYQCHLDLWLAEVMGIEGIPIPYGAPYASPHIERFNRTLREEALNHFIFLDAKHVLRVCREYVELCNRARPSQALHAIPEPYPELITPPRRSGELIALPVLGGIQHDYRLAA